MIRLLYEIPDIVRFNSQIKINIGAQQERSELFPEGYIKATDNDIWGESAITKPSSTEVNKQHVQPNCNNKPDKLHKSIEIKEQQLASNLRRYIFFPLFNLEVKEQYVQPNCNHSRDF